MATAESLFMDKREGDEVIGDFQGNSQDFQLLINVMEGFGLAIAEGLWKETPVGWKISQF